MFKFFNKLIGDTNEKALKEIQPIVDEITDRLDDLQVRPLGVAADEIGLADRALGEDGGECGGVDGARGGERARG